MKLIKPAVEVEASRIDSGCAVETLAKDTKIAVLALFRNRFWVSGALESKKWSRPKA